MPLDDAVRYSLAPLLQWVTNVVSAISALGTIRT